MKPSYSGFESKRSSGFVELPPVGAYVAEIMNVRYVGKNPAENIQRDMIELMIDISEGDYKGQYMKVFNDQKERFGDRTKFKGVFRLTPPVDGDEDWRRRTFEGNLWCVEQSNPGYQWDWDENKLKGKKVGISIRKRLYNYTNNDGEAKDGETTEIGRFETVDDVRSGKVKPMKDRDQRQQRSEDPGKQAGFADVSRKVDVPW